MKNMIFLCAALCTITCAVAQNKFYISIKDKETKAVLPGATVSVKNAGINAISDKNGIALISNINAGNHQITAEHVGYVMEKAELEFPLSISDTFKIFLTEDHQELDEIMVQSTRTSRSIANTPTRLEVIDAEELDEKSNMRPSNVAMVLHESTGLQVQQTSATSGNASIRVQGLDGKYTQLLKDGYPNFGNFASGLSILEIPPLDLKQVEIIKGPSSTLYGGGAIAGVINFISKTPAEKGEYNFILNQSNVGQTNTGVFAARKKGRWGYSFLGLVNWQKAYDVDKDGFSELPESNNFTVNPTLFFYPGKNSTFIIGNSFTKGKNTGGDIQVIKNKADADHVYFEQNETIRNTTTISFEKKFEKKQSFKIKQSLGFFDRKIYIPAYSFAGLNTNTYTDASYIFYAKAHSIVTGINFIFDRFHQKQNTIGINQDTKTVTTGIYAQDTWDINDKNKIEYGVRLDIVKFSNSNYSKAQTFVLPRASLLHRFSNKLSTRLGGGLGYKIPTIFTEQTESIQYQGVLPLEGTKAEKSIGGTFDLNFKTNISEALLFSINQLFFYTRISDPLVLQKNPGGDLYFANAAKPITSGGFETNIKFIYHDALKLFAGYTFTNAKNTYLQGNQFIPLLPKNKINLALVYEKEDNIKIGLEGYYTGSQYLYNGLQTPSYWEFGAMAQKTFGQFSFFINFENITDERQSKYKGVVNAPFNNPSFDDIWNHTEGFVVNGGIKIKWSRYK